MEVANVLARVCQVQVELRPGELAGAASTSHPIPFLSLCAVKRLRLGLFHGHCSSEMALRPGWPPLLPGSQSYMI